MKILDVVQGTPEWHEAKKKYPRSASLAPIMMGDSSKMARSELIRLFATGEEREISEWAKKNLLDKGHEIEAATRPIAESIIGEELYQITAVSDDDYLLMSLDGSTIGGDTISEIKSWNEDKAKDVRNGEIPKEDFWQVVQQLVVSEAEKNLYIVSDGNGKHVEMFYSLKPGDKERLLAGWHQLDEEVANYQHVEPAAVVVGKAPESLPALRIQVTGSVIASNLDEFRQYAVSVIDSINTNLVTDEDFANADKAVKWLADVEKNIEAAKKHALSQTADIDALMKSLDYVKDELARTKRLSLEKLVAARKEARRAEIVQGAIDDLTTHYSDLNSSLSVKMPLPGDFRAAVAAAMKGKRTIASLCEAAGVVLVNAKIKATLDAERVRANTAELDGFAEHATLFPDRQTLILTKAADDLKAIIASRIAAHKETAEKREAERLASEKREKQRIEEATARNREAEIEKARYAEYHKAIDAKITEREAVSELAKDRQLWEANEPEEWTAEAVAGGIAINLPGLRHTASVENAIRLYKSLGAALRTNEAA